MGRGARDTVAYPLWPPFAVGVPWVVGAALTTTIGDPIELGGWRIPAGLVVAFGVRNGWALWLFGRHRTGLLPGQTTNALFEEGPHRISRDPLYVGLLALSVGLALLAPTIWALLLLPAAVVLTWWGAIEPEEHDLRQRIGGPYEAYARRVRRGL